MADIGTTSIDSLPIANVIDEKVQNTNIVIDDKLKQLQEDRKQLEQQPQTQQPQQQPQQKQEEINQQLNVNEFVSGIQKASSSGALRLPSRDIPQDTLPHTNDEQIQPNFVPPSTTTDYITQHQTTEEILRLNSKKQNENETLDKIYSEISLPLMIAVFYFLYQLPIVRKTLLNTFPSCYSKAGDMNMSGFLLNSGLFGLAVYGTHKLVKYLS